MTLKDSIPLLIVMLTIFSSHILLSRQIRKTKRAEWTESFRNEIADFTSQVMGYTSPIATQEELHQILKASHLILMRLNPKEKLHKKLENHVAQLTLISSRKITPEIIEEFKNHHNATIMLAREIIHYNTKSL
ncbi:MAG: hypothetical protein IT236_17900 [Bacteroidia bacterium]|nr:hypothetical protein [Bacteroidia bacterium]